MITKWYEIVCNGCGCAEHFRGTKKQAENQFRLKGGIIKKGNLHFCELPCLYDFQTKE